MIVKARTEHGQYLQTVKVYADTREEFAQEVRREVGYIRNMTKDETLGAIWDELVRDGTSYHGWTEFVVVM